MHDPMTVAFEIRYPWRAYRASEARTSFDRTYRRSFMTIWHVDPERGGSDDSCGWSSPHLTIAQRDRLKSFAWTEARDPYFLRCGQQAWAGTRVEAEALYRALILHVADMVGIRLTFDAAAKMAAQAIHYPDCADRASVFCFVPGYHTYTTEDRRDDREAKFLGACAWIARELLRDRRPWYRHPRWHFRHWKIQVHPLQALKRWAFSRCAGCGRRFPWGYSPVTFSWNGGGPRWFRSERDVYHSECR
jgi:hypothetical protein